MAIELAITAETLPEGACSLITDEQTRLNLYAANMRASFPGTITGIEVGTTAPTDFDKAWLKLDSQLRPQALYYYNNGQWISKHPMAPGQIVMWMSALPDFNTYDGGSAGAVSDASGPMWEEVTELRAKFPLGVGTLPGGTAVALAATGGLETVPMADHVHTIGRMTNDDNGNRGDDGNFLTGTPTVNAGSARRITGDLQALTTSDISASTGQFLVSATQEKPGGAGTVDEASNMPPYYAVYWLRRTQRLYLVG